MWWRRQEGRAYAGQEADGRTAAGDREEGCAGALEKATLELDRPLEIEIVAVSCRGVSDLSNTGQHFMKFGCILPRAFEEFSQVCRDFGKSFRKLLGHVPAERSRLADSPYNIPMCADEYEVSQSKFNIPVLVH